MFLFHIVPRWLSSISIFRAPIIHVGLTCPQESLTHCHALPRGRVEAGSQPDPARTTPLCPTVAQISAVVLKLSAFTLMSHTQSAAASSSKFQLIINNALDTYRKRTKNDLLTHPLAARLHACDTPAAILTILREQIHGLDQSRSSTERWSKWLDPTVNVLFVFSTTIGAGVGIVCLRSCTHPRSAFSYSLGRYFLPRV
jgi:hypothetical protein